MMYRSKYTLSRRRLLIYAGTLALLTAAGCATEAPYVPVTPTPPLADRPPEQYPHTVYATVEASPDADGTRAQPFALMQVLNNQVVIQPYTRLLLLDAAYFLEGDLHTTFSHVQIAHIDDAPVTLYLAGNWSMHGTPIHMSKIGVIGIL